MSGNRSLLHSIHVALVEVRRLVTYVLIRTGAFAVIYLTSPDSWYRTTFRISHFLAAVSTRLRPHVHDPSLEARLLGRFLDSLTESRKLFPIPARIEGGDLLMEVAAQPGGFVLCSAHLPLVKPIITQSRRMLGDDYAIGVAAKYVRPDGTIFVWGDHPITGVKADGTMLIRTRSLFRRNGCLMLLVDKEQGEAIPTSIFRFVGKMHARILSTFSYLQPDGTILIRFVQPPAPLCRNEEEVQANLDFIAATVQEIIAGKTAPPATKRTVPIWKPLPDHARNREIERIHLYSCEQLAARIRRLSQQLEKRATPAEQDGTASRLVLEERLALMKKEQELRCGNS